jgi:catechol 2,3-dioxygenase-like lactoylglutathione lyase family enzyme
VPDHAHTISTKAVIAGAEPQLFVADIKASCEFFAKKLGFAIAFTYGEPPFYAQVKRDAALVNLRCVERPVIDAVLRDREQLLSASLTVASAEEIKALFLEFQSAGVTYFQTLKREPWGARDFIVQDPDGNLLLFAGPADQSALIARSRRPVPPPSAGNPGTGNRRHRPASAAGQFPRRTSTAPPGCR